MKDTNEVHVRSAVADDADAIARVFVESAVHHARLDPGRYTVPTTASISERYRSGQQHGVDGSTENVTLVAELNGDTIVGFVDARLDRSPDPMHRDLLYCHVEEIAVSGEYRSCGIGGRLLRAAEDWGRRHGAEFAYLEYHADNPRAGESISAKWAIASRPMPRSDASSNGDTYAHSPPDSGIRRQRDDVERGRTDAALH